MRFHILTLFPEMFSGFFSASILHRAQEKNMVTFSTSNIRDFSTDKHRRVDAPIYGGGAGMLLRPEPLAGAIRDAKEKFPDAKVIYFSPSGSRLTQKKVEQLATEKHDLILLCGRYEGIDQRIRATMVDEEISVGDFVLSGGEIAAALMVDAVTRLLPGVLGSAESIEEESFSRSLFRCAEFPQFTRPRVWENLSVPEVLLKGDHAAIEKWRFAHLPQLEPMEEKMIAIRRDAFPRKTKHLFWRVHEKGDIDFWLKWVNDEEVTRFLPIAPPLTREDEEEFFEFARENLAILPITICEQKPQKPIGTLSLEIEAENPTSAMFGVMIGEKEWWGKGLCQEILHEVLRIGFDDFSLERIFLKVAPENISAIRCYEKCGFRKIGLMKKSLLRKKELRDQLFYEVLREDWSKE